MSMPLETSESPGTQQTKLRLEGVSRSFKTPRGLLSALENIDLNVREGEFVCLVGPSGCGKSTLLSVMAGLDQPTSGAVWRDGARVERPGTDRIVIFQELGLFPWLTVRENVEFGLRLKGVGRRGTARTRAALPSPGPPFAL